MYTGPPVTKCREVNKKIGSYRFLKPVREVLYENREESEV